MPETLKVESLCNRQAVPLLDQPQLVYILTTLSPGPDIAQTRMPLNFTLLLDHSGSMAGEKLRTMKEAVKNIIDSAHTAGIWVGMCGEMASEPAFLLLLLGLGLDEFSMPPLAIPRSKFIIRAVSMAQAREISAQALELSTGKEVEEFSQSKLRELLG